MVLIQNLNYKLGVFSVVWIIITSGSVFFNQYDSVKYTLIVDLFIVFVQFMSVRKKLLSRYQGQIFLYLSITACFLLSVIGNSDYAFILSYARVLLVIALALGTSLLVPNDVIVATLVKVVVALAGISVLFFYSGIIDRYSNLFPVIQFRENYYVNAFIYLFHDSIDDRNLGIFIEPGLYQIYLNIALLVLLYCKETYRFTYISVITLLIALYSTKSTTGYLLGLFIIAGYVFSLKLSVKNMFSLPFKVTVVVVVVSLVFLSTFFSSNLEEKFFGDKHKSFDSRRNSSIIDYLIIADHPLIGAGVGSYQGLLDQYDNSGLTIDSSANTFSQLGATVGVPFVLLILWRCRLYVFRLEFGFVGKWISFTLFIISFSTQPFVLYPLFYLPVFMSYRGRQLNDWFGDQVKPSVSASNQLEDQTTACSVPCSKGFIY